MTGSDIAAFLKRSFRDRNPNESVEVYAKASADIDWLCGRVSADELRRKMMESFHPLMEQTRVFSMSQRWNNMAMWAKYAADHRGYCLEFARAGLFNAAREVIYDDSMRLDLANPEHHTGDWLFCKSADWSNEQEIRLVLARSMGGPPFPVGPDALRRIILGDAMTAADETQIRAWARQRVPELSIRRAVYDPYSQALMLAP